MTTSHVIVLQICTCKTCR